MRLPRATAAFEPSRQAFESRLPRAAMPVRRQRQPFRPPWRALDSSVAAQLVFREAFGAAPIARPPEDTERCRMSSYHTAQGVVPSVDARHAATDAAKVQRT